MTCKTILRLTLAAVGVAWFGLAAPLLAAQKIKLATLAPTGTSYHKSLLAMGEKWRKDSGGAIQLMIYPDGKLGGEADTVGLMGLNSVQAAMLTAVGLSEIELAVAGLQSLPMGFNDFAEVDWVGERLQPMLEARLASRGFVVLFWTDAGWVRFFSKKPVVHPDDLKKLKLFTWAGNADAVRIYKSVGMDPVPLETADILPSLRTGLIQAAPVPPFFAMASQVDLSAPYLLELNWAPLVGACVIRKDTWEKIPANLRDTFRQAAIQAGKEIKASGRRESERAVEEMQKRGLKVAKVNPAIEAEWRAVAELAYPGIRGRVVPADIFDKTLSLLKEYRATQGK